MEVPERGVAGAGLRRGQGIPALDDLDQEPALLQEGAVPPARQLRRPDDVDGRRGLRPAQGLRRDGVVGLTGMAASSPALVSCQLLLWFRVRLYYVLVSLFALVSCHGSTDRRWHSGVGPRSSWTLVRHGSGPRRCWADPLRAAGETDAGNGHGAAARRWSRRSMAQGVRSAGERVGRCPKRGPRNRSVFITFDSTGATARLRESLAGMLKTVLLGLRSTADRFPF